MDADDPPLQTGESSPTPTPEPTGAEPTIVARNLQRVFDDEVALDHLDLTIPRGTIYGFVGPSGSGKTTAVKLLTGIDAPTRGSVEVLGRPVSAFDGGLRRRIGYLPQNSVQFPNLSVRENLSFAASLYGLPLRRRSTLDAVLERTELLAHHRKPVHALSGGMQRRLALSAALVHDPEVVFLDEPTAGLDPVLRRKMWDWLEGLRDEGATLFVTTQYVGEAAYCDRVGMLSFGGLVAEDSPEGLRRRVLGGDVLDLTPSTTIEPARREQLSSVGGVRHVHLIDGGPTVRVVVDDAARRLPQLQEWVRQAGLQIAVDQRTPRTVRRHLRQTHGATPRAPWPIGVCMMASLIRVVAFVRKESIDVVRQPTLLLALIIGPFLILLAFGAGLRETDPPLRAALIVADSSEIRAEIEAFADAERDRERLEITGVSGDRDTAIGQLRERSLDLVLVFPEQVIGHVEREEQAVIEVYHNQIDPIEGQAIALFSRSAVDELNNRVLVSVIEEFQQAVRDSGGAEFGETAQERQAANQYLDMDPNVVVSPFRGEVEMVTGQAVELTDFYAPAVVVVPLQHLAITLLGLSVVRERALGATELFRVSPLRTSEYLAGKFLAFLLLGSVVAAALIALLVLGLGVPMNGVWWHLVVSLALLLFTSTAVGLVLAMLANSDSKAVQYAMLMLLATIFLSGFLLSLERFVPIARPLPWLLPSTYGIQLTRDVMLRGASLDPLVMGGLATYGALFAMLAARLAHRRMNAPGV